MALSRNVLAGLASSGWTTLVGLAVVPLYLRFLGLEAYGIVGFFTTLQALLQVLDLGLTPTLNREVARAAAAGTPRAAAPLLHTLAVIFWATAVVVGCAVALASPLIAQQWLQAGGVQPATLQRAVALIGVVIAARWPAGVYVGALMGAERIAMASALTMAATTFTSLGAVAILAFVSPTLEAFFLWQAAAGLAHALAARWVAWSAIGRSADLRFDTHELRRVWGFSAAMSAIGVLGVLFMQLDKVILSRVLSLSEFAQYMLATTVASSLYLLIMPMFNALYPRFSALVATDNALELAALYRHGTRVLTALLFPVVVLIAIGGEAFVSIWTDDPALAARVAPIAALLAAGSALHGIMYLPYALQLAHGLTRLPLQIGLALMAALVPLISVLAVRFGARGGALAWLALHCVYFVLGTWLTHRHVLRGLGWTWASRDVATPLALSAAAGGIGSEALRLLPHAPVSRFAGAVLVAAATFAVVIAASPDLRATAIGVVRAASRRRRG